VASSTAPGPMNLGMHAQGEERNGLDRRIPSSNSRSLLGGHGKLLLWSPYPLRVKTSISSCSFSCRIGLGAPVPWWPLMALLAEIGFGARTRTYCTILCVQFCWLLLGCAEAQVICKHD
jgi:hypothetical protein